MPFFFTRAQLGFEEIAFAQSLVCVLLRPHHGLDVPRLEKASYLYVKGHSLLMNQEYVCEVAQSVIPLANW